MKLLVILHFETNVCVCVWVWVCVLWGWKDPASKPFCEFRQFPSASSLDAFRLDPRVSVLQEAVHLLQNPGTSCCKHARSCRF